MLLLWHIAYIEDKRAAKCLSCIFSFVEGQNNKLRVCPYGTIRYIQDTRVFL